MQNLINFKTGDRLKIKCVNCGHNFKCRLIDLGLYDGAEIEIIKNDNFGPLLIRVLDSKIALGRGEAAKIYGEKI